MGFIQKLRPLRKIFWVYDNEKTACYQITFHMKFEETVKPGQTLIKDGKIKAVFFKEPALWEHFISIRSSRKSRRGLNGCVMQHLIE